MTVSSLFIITVCRARTRSPRSPQGSRQGNENLIVPRVLRALEFDLPSKTRDSSRNGDRRPWKVRTRPAC